MGAAQFRVVRWMVGIGCRTPCWVLREQARPSARLAAGVGGGFVVLGWVAVLDVAPNYRRVVVGGVVVSGGAARFLRTV